MNKFIIIFVILNIQFLIGSTFVLDQLKNLNYPEAISSEEWEKLNVSKINWLPVWQAEEQHSKPIIVLRDGINQQEVEEEARYASEQEMSKLYLHIK